MNDKERQLLRFLCNGSYKQAEQQARIILNDIQTQKDQQFKNAMLSQLDKRNGMAELPKNGNGKQLLVAEDVSNFPLERFLLRPADEKVVNEAINLYRVSNELMELGIPYLPAVILHGKSGCGKTMLAKYIAYKANLPYVYVRFSYLVESYLGSSQQNIAKVIDFVKSTPCVICFDEIDAVGMARGQKNDVGEMNRIVIAMMQELDTLSNNVIVVGTTNRFDRLDAALIRRFPISHEVLPLSLQESTNIAKAFFAHTKIDCESWIQEFAKEHFSDSVPASDVIKECTNIVVRILLERQNNSLL